MRLFFKIGDARDFIHVNCTLDGIPDLSIRQDWDVHQDRCVLLAGHDGVEERECTKDQVTQLALDPLFL
ncbi:MAG: hypothetical protein OXI66_08020 [Boseongicola sp.]|nr:hypothetical protein [Boseongicola sp.]